MMITYFGYLRLSKLSLGILPPIAEAQVTCSFVFHSRAAVAEVRHARVDCSARHALTFHEPLSRLIDSWWCEVTFAPSYASPIVL